MTLSCSTVLADMNMKPNSGSPARGVAPSAVGSLPSLSSVSAGTSPSSSVVVNSVNMTSV